MTNEDTAAGIQNLRRSLDLSQEKFASKLSVSFSTVNRWERGHGKPSPLAKERIEQLRWSVGR